MKNRVFCNPASTRISPPLELGEHDRALLRVGSVPDSVLETFVPEHSSSIGLADVCRPSNYFSASRTPQRPSDEGGQPLRVHYTCSRWCSVTAGRWAPTRS